MKRVKEGTLKLREGFLRVRLYFYSLLFGFYFCQPTFIHAAGGADAKWNSVIQFVTPWIGRFGGLVLLIGAVEFGLAFKSDDAEGKTRGIRTIVAGCIVVAVGASTSTFL